MAICVYCQQDRKLTREHVFSNVLLRVFDDVAPLTHDRERGIAYSGDPLIKDLCGPCNAHLSPCDTTIGSFAQTHLTLPRIVNQTPAVAPALLKLWVVKTSANIARTSPAGGQWWLAYTDYFRGLATAPRCDVLFANWRDYSPFDMASELNLAMTIDSQEARLFGFAEGSSNGLRQFLDHSQAIKVGFGVFVMLSWKDTAPPIVRTNVLAELRTYGWLGLDDPFWLARVPYNVTSCANFNLVADPDKALHLVLHADELRQD